MEIRVQSIKFNADQKLLDFVEKKFSRIEKFYDAITGVDVALSLLPDHENKNVKVQVSIPGNIHTCNCVIEFLHSREFLFNEVQQFLICIELNRLHSNLHVYLRFLPLDGLIHKYTSAVLWCYAYKPESPPTMNDPKVP